MVEFEFEFEFASNLAYEILRVTAFVGAYESWGSNIHIIIPVRADKPAEHFN